MNRVIVILFAACLFVTGLAGATSTAEASRGGSRANGARPVGDHVLNRTSARANRVTASRRAGAAANSRGVRYSRNMTAIRTQY